MLFEYTYKISNKKFKTDKAKAIMMSKRMLPEYVFDTAKLENNPITFPEVQTLMDGITIGGRRINDVEQILNIKEAWHCILSDIADNTFFVAKSYFQKINKIFARNEAIYAGIFRNGSVGIAGTSNYKSPNFEDLEKKFLALD